jgi:hypothetical protein
MNNSKDKNHESWTEQGNKNTAMLPATPQPNTWQASPVYSEFLCVEPGLQEATAAMLSVHKHGPVGHA